jgi:hypothetical protein
MSDFVFFSAESDLGLFYAALTLAHQEIGYPFTIRPVHSGLMDWQKLFEPYGSPPARG